MPHSSYQRRMIPQSYDVRTEQIRTAAYLLWKIAGCPDGRDVEFWLAAETQWNEVWGSRGYSDFPAINNR